MLELLEKVSRLAIAILLWKRWVVSGNSVVNMVLNCISMGIKLGSIVDGGC